MKIRVPKLDKTVGSLFGLMENNKEEYDIQDYSISQTTLEQIFHEFAQGTDKKNYRENRYNKRLHRVIKMDRNECLIAESDQVEDLL